MVDPQQYHQPDTKLTYAIPGDDQGGCLFVYYGPHNRQASRIVLASAGFPDDHQGLASVAVQLAKRHDCLVGIVCPPGFDDRPDDGRPWTAHARQGYHFGDITNCYHEALKVLKSHSTRSNAKLIYLLHDWGVVFGLQLANRHLKEEEANQKSKTYAPDRIIILDVALKPHPSERSKIPQSAMPPRPSLIKSVYQNGVEQLYRVALAVIYLIYYYFGSHVAVGCLQLFGLLLSLPLLRFLKPASSADDAFVAQKNLHHLTYMSYIYYEMFKSLLFGKNKQKIFAGLYLPRLETTPVLFLYGTDKNVPFHPDTTVALLKQEMETKDKSNVDNSDNDKKGNGDSSSRVVAVDKAGHWLHLQQPEICRKEIGKFVDELL